MAWGEDGPTAHKAPPASFNSDIRNFYQAVEWIKRHLLQHFGTRVTKVVHDAYPNLWRCYDDDGDVIVNVDHELMARLALVLEEIDYHKLQEEMMDQDDEELRKKWLEDEES